jgi:hypothetical protein
MGCSGSKSVETAVVGAKTTVVDNAAAPAAATPAAAAPAAAAPAAAAPAAEAPAAPAPAVAPAAAEAPPVTLADFEVGKELGKGSFGTVTLGVKKDTGEKFAIKSLNKRMLVAVKQVKGAMTEASVLKQERHPCVVSMYYAFQDDENLHMVLDYMPGGDLYDRIEDEGKIPLERSRLYAAEITSALCHMHDVLGVIYRDLKPENILLDEQGHAKLTDFGLVKGAGGGGGGSRSGLLRAKTFVGTLEYMAPEVMVQSGAQYTKAVDWWGLGVLLHELLCGETPFCADSNAAIQRNVLDASKELSFPPIVTDAKADGLIRQLLTRDPAARLGEGDSGSNDVQSDGFWAALSFDAVRRREYTPGWKPADGKFTRVSGGEGEEGEGEGEGEGEEGSDDDEGFDEEWHMMLKDAPPPKLGDFKGFSFVRAETFQPKNLERQPTRLVRKRSTMVPTKLKSTIEGEEEKV